MLTLSDFLLARLEDDERTCEQFRKDAPRTRLEQRMWAEVDAKRRIVDLHAPDREGWHICHDSLADDSDCGELRALAAIYADHPDYQQEWTP